MRQALSWSVVCCALLSGCGSVSTNRAPQKEPSRFTYTRLYCTPGHRNALRSRDDGPSVVRSKFRNL